MSVIVIYWTLLTDENGDVIIDCRTIFEFESILKENVNKIRNIFHPSHTNPEVMQWRQHIKVPSALD